MSIDALAMAGVDCLKCSIDLEEMELREMETTPLYLLGEDKSFEESKNEEKITVKQLQHQVIEPKMEERDPPGVYTN